MKSYAVIFDVDDTVLDTAVRRHRLLQSHLPRVDITIDEVRRDFSLTRYLGPLEGPLARSYYHALADPEVVKDLPIEAISGAKETLDRLRQTGVRVYFLSGRPERLRDVTLNDLKLVGGVANQAELLLCPDSNQTIHLLDLDVGSFKADAVRSLAANNVLIACVGDSVDDFNAATRANIPAVILTTTLAPNILSQLALLPHVGLVVCDTWAGIDSAIDGFDAGSKEIRSLRQIYADQYSGWLKNLNEKSRILAAISAGVAGLAGTVLRSETLAPWEGILLSTTFISSMLALLYSIEAFTSRHSSGREASQPISVKFRQWVAFLVGFPRSWQRIKGDPIDEYIQLRAREPQEQAQAHLQFFFAKYGTHDPEALLNFRLFEMRAINYSKLYPERIGSHLLRFAIVVFCIWVSISAWHTVKRGRASNSVVPPSTVVPAIGGDHNGESPSTVQERK